MKIYVGNKIFIFINSVLEKNTIHYVSIKNIKKELDYSFVLNFLFQLLDYNTSILNNNNNNNNLINYINEIIEYIILTNNELSKITLGIQLVYIYMHNINYFINNNYKINLNKMNDKSEFYNCIEFLISNFVKTIDFNTKNTKYIDDNYYTFSIVDFIYDYYNN